MGYSHGYKWNDQKIEDDIKNVMRSLGIKRMPTLSEMDETWAIRGNAGNRRSRRWEKERKEQQL